MDRVFQNLIDDNFSELAGLAVDASIPVPEHFLNEMIDAALQGNKIITYCRVSISGENRVAAKVKIHRWPWPFNLKLRLFRSVELARSPKIRAFLENYAFVGQLGLLLKALPAGINIYEDQMVVDLGPFLQTPEQRAILSLLKSVDIRTMEAKIIFDVKIGIE